jgi:HEAT repeat protein
MRILRILLFVFCLGSAVSAHAASFKRSVLENCDEARVQLHALSSEEKAQALSYLGLVLQLRVDQLHTPSIGSVRVTGGPLAIDPQLQPMIGDELLRSLDPDREKESRRCALKLLTELKPLSVNVVPALIQTAALQEVVAVDPEMSLRLQEAIREIVLSTKGLEGYAPEPKLLQELGELLRNQENEVSAKSAGRVFIEFREESIPYLFDLLRTPDTGLRNALIEILLEIDSEGDLVGEGFLSLLSQEDDGLRKRAVSALSKLPRYFSQSLPAVVGRLSDVSHEVQTAAEDTLVDFKTRTSLLRDVQIDDSTFRKLIRHLPQLPPTKREGILSLIQVLTKGHPDFVSSAFNEAGDTNIAPSWFPLLATIGGTDRRVIELFLQSASAESVETRLAALENLGKLQADFSQTIKGIESILRRNEREKDPLVREAMVYRCAATIVQLQPGKVALPLARYFLSALSWTSFPKEGPTPIEALGAIGPGILPKLEPLLRSKELLVRRRAAQVTSLITPLSSEILQGLSRLLNDPDEETSRRAADALEKAGILSLPVLRTAFTRFSGRARYTAARLMYPLLTPSKERAKLLPIIRENLNQESCRKYHRVAEAIILENRPLLAELLPKTFECLGSPFRDEVRNALDFFSQVSPLTPDEASHLITFIKSGSLEPSVRFEVLSRYRTIGLPVDVVKETVTQLIQNGEDATRIRAIEILGEMGPLAADAIPVLQKIREDQEKGELLRHEAVIALVRINPEAFDYGRFFSQELSSEDYKWAIKSLLKIEPSRSVPIITNWIKEADPARRYIVRWRV